MCSKCAITKPLSKFNKNGRGGLRSDCKLCERDLKLSYVYNMTVDEYRAILFAQGFSCAVCGEMFGESNAPCVDHDHDCCPSRKSCGRCNRGLVCHRCNKVLGMVEDDPDLLERLTEYLHDRSTVGL